MTPIEAAANAFYELSRRAGSLHRKTDVPVYCSTLYDNKETFPHLWILTSDLFAWGYADAETLTNEFVDAWEKAVNDIEAVYDNVEDKTSLRRALGHAWALAMCRRENMRPQGAYYKYIPQPVWHLFNACGPKRPAGPGNPYETPDVGEPAPNL